MAVPSKLHDDLGRDTAVRELGNKAAPPAVAGCTFDASLAVQLSEQLAERIGREGTVLLSAEQRGGRIGYPSVEQLPSQWHSRNVEAGLAR